MGPFLQKKPVSCVDLDIQADEVRFMRFQQNPRGFLVEGIAIAALEKDLIIEGRLKQFDLVLGVIKRLVRQTQTVGLPALLAIPAVCVMSKRIKLPVKAVSAQAEAKIANHLPQYFKAQAEELCFDFVVVNETEIQEDILVVAAATETVNAYVMLAALSGLQVKVVDVDQYAQQRALALQETGHPQFREKNTAENFEKHRASWMTCAGLALRSTPWQ